MNVCGTEFICNDYSSLNTKKWHHNNTKTKNNIVRARYNMNVCTRMLVGWLTRYCIRQTQQEVC